MTIQFQIYLSLVLFMFSQLGCEDTKAKEAEPETGGGGGTAEPGDPSVLVGTWVLESSTATLRYTFRADGTATLIEDDILESTEQEVHWGLEGNLLMVSSPSTEDGYVDLWGATIFIAGDRFYPEVLVRSTPGSGLDGTWEYLELEGERMVDEGGRTVETVEEWSSVLTVQGDHFDFIEKLLNVQSLNDGERQVLSESSITASGTVRTDGDAVYLSYEEASAASPAYPVGEEALLGFLVADGAIVYSSDPDAVVDDLCFTRGE